MYRNPVDLEDQLRSARTEFKLDSSFNTKVMRLLPPQKPYRDSFYMPFHLRTAGLSLVLAGFLLLFLNTTPLGASVTGMATTVKSATIQWDTHLPALEKISRYWHLYGIHKEDLL